MNMQASLYPVDALVKVLREAAMELHQNVQAPLELCSVSLLSNLSAATGERVKVKMPYGGMPKPATTYWAVVAESGERKTAVDGLSGKELGLRDQFRENLYKRSLNHYETEKRIWTKAEQKLISRIVDLEQKGEWSDGLRMQLGQHVRHKPVKPRQRRLIRQDMTERAIMDALEGDGESIALICDEGEILLRSAVLNKPSLLNKAWDGGPFHFDRKDRSIVATDIRCTVSVMVQSSILKRYLDRPGNAVRGSGFWARFLMCWPQSTQGWRYVSHLEPNWGCLEDFHALIREILEDEAQYVYEFDADAKTEFINLLNQIEVEIRPWGGCLADISDFASKAGENVARIAALLHHASRQTGKISVDTLLRAWTIVKWHLGETKRIFAPRVEMPQDQIDAQAVEAYLRTYYFKLGIPVQPAPRNAVLRNGPVRPVARLRDALDCLGAQGKVTVWAAPDRRRFISPGPKWVW